MLITREHIFGDVGKAIHIFLTGTFGYFAFPICIGSAYLFFMMLIDKRLVKKRLAGVMLALSIIFAGLAVHTILTRSWGLEGYVAQCFDAGNSLSTCTVTGLLGGLLVFAMRSLLSNVGATILFIVLCVVFGYLFALCLRKKKLNNNDTSNKVGKQKYQEGKKIVKTKAEKGPIAQQTNKETTDSNVVSNPANASLPSSTAQSQNATGDMYYTQRPGVRLADDNASVAKQNSNTYGFSPFGTSNQQVQNAPKKAEESYGDARQFLFGNGARESYKQNLIFDPTANVNNLPPVEPIPAQERPMSEYRPSYTEDYQNSINQNQGTIRPQKIVTDNSYDVYGSSQQNYGYSQPAQTSTFTNDYREEEAVDPFLSSNVEAQAQPYVERNEEMECPFVEPLKPMEEMAPPIVENSYYEPERTEYLDVRNDEPPMTYARENVVEQEEPVQEILQETTPNAGYQRHEFFNLFAVDNPNELSHDDVFKSQSMQEESRFSCSVEEEPRFDRGGERDVYERVPSFEEESIPERMNERDGLHVFDDEVNFDNPYVLQSEYDDARRDYADEPYVESTRTERIVDEGMDRGRAFDESPEDLPLPIEPPKQAQPTPANTFKAASTPSAPAPKPPKPRVIKPYVRMSLDDLDCRDVEPTQNPEEVEDIKATIIATLEEFKISGATIASVTFGPTVTRYNVTLPCGILPSKVMSLDQLISMKLHTEGVSIYPNFKNGAVSVEVPNTQRQFVQLGSMLSGDSYVNAKPSSLMFAMGKDVSNQKVYGDISKMIHLLVAGASGSGKSVFLGALIISLIYKYSPEELRLILIDPKKTEFVLYNDLPHLMINEIITDANKAVQSLNWAIEEMNRRYGLFQEMSNAGTYVVNLDQYNEKLEKAKRLPKIVIIIDELADLMLEAKKDMEEKVQNLTQKARAAGIHLIVATQRPSTDVITGVIKSNLPTRIAFGVASEVDSRVILDQTGAHKLLGKGDFLYTMQSVNTPVRVQSAFISPEESQKVVNFIKANNEAYYDESATAYINNTKGSTGDTARGERDIEPVYIEALRYVILSGSASISMIQRKCSAGYNKAGKIIEWMEEMGYISPFEGAKARKVLISKEEFESKYGPL